MNTLKLKVCGMSDPENIRGLLGLAPDFIGFIFYKKSPRFNDSLDERIVFGIPHSIKKVGVFVNESLEVIVQTVRRYGLDYVQLHGDEDIDFAVNLKDNGIKIIKVFRIWDTLPICASHYQGVADYFLFDTATKDYGGSGRQFNWTILKDYNLKVPFLLSGGVHLSDVENIRSMDISNLIGIDVNSRFEIEPGLKNLERIKELKAML